MDTINDKFDNDVEVFNARCSNVIHEYRLLITDLHKKYQMEISALNEEIAKLSVKSNVPQSYLDTINDEIEDISNKYSNIDTNKLLLRKLVLLSLDLCRKQHVNHFNDEIEVLSEVLKDMDNAYFVKYFDQELSNKLDIKL